jgi:hypothetical protein
MTETRDKTITSLHSKVGLIADRIKAVLPKDYYPISVTLDVNETSYNAYCFSEETEWFEPAIVIGIKMVEGQTDEYIASVLAHEFAHIVLGHVSNPVKGKHASKQRERDADSLGLYFFTMAGFDKSRYIDSYDFEEAENPSGYYPSFAERKKAIYTLLSDLYV